MSKLLIQRRYRRQIPHLFSEENYFFTGQEGSFRAGTERGLLDVEQLVAGKQHLAHTGKGHPGSLLRGDGARATLALPISHTHARSRRSRRRFSRLV